ncbi:MAG: tRNA lysidine(34) synthetase TilS [Chloroflexota bacterium]
MDQPASQLSIILQNALDECSAIIGRPLKESRLVIGVSGGPDSLALLHALRQLVPPDNLVAAHLDHQLRPESAEDALFVRSLAERWGVTFQESAVDVAELAQANHQTLEEAGRHARYRYLADTARATGATAVLTGHHADDQAETVLMHILRGSGLAGLQGMLPAAPMPADLDIWLVRPLLHAGRADIDTYCRQNDLHPLTDVTNTDTTYFRNRLRHGLLPILETYNPQIKTRLEHLASVVAADYALLSELTAEAYADLMTGSGSGWVSLRRRSWQSLPPALRRSTLRAALAYCVPQQRDVGFVLIEAAREAAEAEGSGRRIELPGNVTLHVTAEELFLTADDSFPSSFGPQLSHPQPISLPVPGEASLGDGWVLTADFIDGADFLEIIGNPDPWTAYIVADSAESLVVRGRSAGERMQPLGMDGHSTPLRK